jgi:hypothetical protein
VVEFLETVPGHGLAIAGGCLIDLYASVPDERHLDVVEGVLARRGAPLSHLIVLSGQGLRPPSSLFRQRAVAISERASDRVRCRANVVDVTGLVGATARAVLAGLTLAERTRFPQQVFATLDEACAWMLSHDDGVVPREVLATVPAIQVRARKSGT